MRRRTKMGLWIVAVCAMGAVAAASASAAAPEIGRCKKVVKGSGKYSSAACTTLKAGGEYEWAAGAEKGKFTTKGGIAILEQKGGAAVACKTEASGGEYTGPKTVGGVVVTFTGCESGGIKCKTAGSAEGELVTKPLEGVIGIEKRVFVEGKEVAKKNKIAFDLFPVGKTGLFIEFSCSTLALTVQGSILVPLTPTNKMLSALTLKYSAKGGVQKPTHFEGEPIDVLESKLGGGAFLQSGQTVTTVQTNEELLEVNTVV
jgi:hypothetical protein